MFYRIKLFLMLIGATFITSEITAQTSNDLSKGNSEDVNITIDALTTDENFRGIIKMLSNYGITAKFENLKRSSANQIKRIKISLVTNNGQKISSQIKSSSPIENIYFGRKDGALYLGEYEDLPNVLSYKNGQPEFDLNKEKDSMRSGNPDFDTNDVFNNPSSVFLFEGDSLAIDQIKERTMQNFSFKNSMNDRFSFLFDDNYDDEQKTYRFVDNPNLKRVVIIDGEIQSKDSGINTLNALAKANKLDTVDSLQPKTAMSIYGEKARDGAIIVTTKK